MDAPWSALYLALAVGLSPLLVSVINRTKAFFGGRHGPGFFQPYADILKLLGKGAVYSRTTTWIFRAGPVVGLAAVITAAALAPLGPAGSVLSFSGDLILFACLFGLMRFVTVLAALDTGSAFEGMGASREVQFAALSEVALLLGLAALAALTRDISLTGIFYGLGDAALTGRTLAVNFLVAISLFIVVLAENSRIPIDDPETHLELTMIHEVMVLDHGGVDLGLIQIGACLKLWVLGNLLVGVVLPFHTGLRLPDMALDLLGMFALAVSIGIVESTMARLRLVRVPQLLVAAGILSLLALMVVPR